MALDAADLEIITRTLIAPLVDELRIEIRELRIEVRGVATETRATRTEMVAGIAGLTNRVEHLILTTGEHWRDHERRLLRLERRRDGNGSGSDEDESGDE